MYVEPFFPVSSRVHQVVRQLAMNVGWIFMLLGALFASLMFWVLPFVPDAITAPLTLLLGGWTLTSILGTLVAILCAWAPVHDELIRRKNAPLYEGFRVRRCVLIQRFTSVSLLGATPPPRRHLR